jgi:hypothetical protein
VPAVRPPASYEGPAEYFKPLSNTTELEGLLVPIQDLVKQLQDPQFRMSDGLSGFSDHRITQALLQDGLIRNAPIPDDGKGLPVPEDGKSEPIPDDGRSQPVPEDGKFLPGNGVASFADFGKLFMMENTAQKQLQLHQQLDVGAFSGFAIPKQVVQPDVNRSKLNPGLKGMPDAQAVTPHSEGMLNLPLDHALNGTPATVGEFRQMIDVLQAEVKQIVLKNGPDGFPFINQCTAILEHLKYLEEMYQNTPSTSPLSNASLNHFQMIRQEIKKLLSYV